MKALYLRENHPEKIEIVDVKVPQISGDQVLIKLSAAAFNRRDQWLREGMYPEIRYDCILGSDGCGEVVEASHPDHQGLIGKKVIINPNLNWGENDAFPSSEYQILGMPSHGTFAEYVAVPAKNVFEKPDHLSDEEAAALPLAGLTAYRAVFYKGKVKKNNKVLVTGIGGGVAQLASQLALHAGAEVYVSSGEDSKIQSMKKKGIIGGVNYKNENWWSELKHLSGGFDVIIDSAGGESFTYLLRCLKPGGTLVFYGATTGSTAAINLPKIFFGQYTIKGSTMGSDQEFVAMIDWVNKHQIKPLVSTIIPFDKIYEGFAILQYGNHFGKIVVDLSSLD